MNTNILIIERGVVYNIKSVICAVTISNDSTIANTPQQLFNEQSFPAVNLFRGFLYTLNVNSNIVYKF